MKNFDNSNFGCESLSANDYIQVTGGTGILDGLSDLVQKCYDIGKEVGGAIVRGIKAL